ncbi:hypothetical protein M8J75_016422 [Diaphorina citri]|nr:hypothetical protein M8J75_016422 [Diaphorina citri]
MASTSYKWHGHLTRDEEAPVPTPIGAWEEKEEDNIDENVYRGDWADLPELILEKIYSTLNMSQRYAASQVCRNWYYAFHLPASWHTFVFDDHTLTRRKYNYYSGWTHMLDHLRTQMCLSTVGKHFKALIFAPETNFYNLYEFMSMISYYAETKHHALLSGLGSKVHTLRYTFPCSQATRKLLEALKRLMNSLPSLRRLELVDLMLDSFEAIHLLDDVCFNQCTTMTHLTIINATKYICPLLHLTTFVNLKVLVVSPQNIGDDVIKALADSNLAHLHIVQNRYTPVDVVAVAKSAWKRCKFRVHLGVSTRREKTLLIQEGARVSSVIYASPQIKLQADTISRVIELYKDTLRVYGHTCLPRYHQAKSFHDRMDSWLLLMCRQSPNLETLMIRERISTATCLLIAHARPTLKHLYIRRNAVILRCDWGYNPEWSSEFYAWLKSCAQSYDEVEKEIAAMLGQSHWTMLSDKEYRNIKQTGAAWGYNSDL